MEYLPIFLDVTGKDVLVVGGGLVAERKVELLLAAGARVTVIAPTLEQPLTDLAREGRISQLAREFREEDVAGRVVVVAATADPSVNEAVAMAAQRRAILVNVVDAPRLCSFIVPSIVDRSPIVAAISSGGAAPVLARLIRARIEALLPADLGVVAAVARRLRRKVKAHIPNPRARRRFWERMLAGQVETPDERPTEASLLAALERVSRDMERAEVHLLGIPANDPDTLTLKALQSLQDADTIIHDRRTADAILALARRDAIRIPMDDETALPRLLGEAVAEHRRAAVIVLNRGETAWRSLCRLDCHTRRLAIAS